MKHIRPQFLSNPAQEWYSLWLNNKKVPYFSSDISDENMEFSKISKEDVNEVLKTAQHSIRKYNYIIGKIFVLKANSPKIKRLLKK